MAMFKCSGALFNGTIIINTTAGATVTATTSGTTRAFQAVANASGVASIRVKKRGTYAIASTGTSRIGHATVSNNTPVTAVYNWTKWNSLLVYAQAVTATWGSGWMVYSTFQYVSIYNAATGYTFNTSNGYYTLTGGSLGTTGSGSVWDITNSGHPYTSYPGTGQITRTMLVQTNSNGSIKVYAETGLYSNGTTASKYESTSSYTKGSTSYGIATSTSLSTYPDNGRSSADGYWYVAA